MKYSHVISEVASTPWAILPEKMAEIMAFLRLKVNGGEVLPDDIAALKRPSGEPVSYEIDEAAVEATAQAVAPSGSSRSRAGSVAVLPLWGTISNRMGMMSEMSGGTSAERFSGWFRAALNDPNVRAIVIDVNSPGGTVQGVPELADQIFKARGTKRIIAQVNATAASAAYWLATQADEVAVTPSSEVGSIGVFAAHEDLTKAVEAQGVKVTFVSAGKYKTEGNPFEPLSEEAKQAIQDKVDNYYDMFTKAVARGRGTTPAAVRSGFGEGRTVSAAKAVELGMADRVATMEQTLTRLGVPRQAVNGAKAEVQAPTVHAEDQKPATVDVTNLELLRKQLAVL